MKKIYLLFIFVLAAGFGFGQSNPGDIAFVALNADGGDDFAFVSLVEIPASAKIYFTDNEWDGSAFNDLNEGELTWTNGGSALSAGSVVVVTDPTSGVSVNVGSISGTGFNFGASNEWMYALLEAPATSYGSTPTFLAAFSNDAGSGWLTGTGLTEGTHAVDFNNDHDGFKYTGARDGEGFFTDYLSLIYNKSNWQDEASNGENILPISTTDFAIAASGPQDPTDFTIANTTSTQIGLSWTNAANSDGVWVVAREGAAPDIDITEGEGAYDYGSISATGNFFTGYDLVDDVGWSGSSGNIVVYSGTGASCTVTGLTEGDDYYFTIFNDYGSQDWSDGAQSSPTNDVAEVQGTSSFAASTSNVQSVLTWSNPSGQGTYWDKVLVLAKSGGAVDATPSGAGSGYTANAAFGSGDEVGTANYVVYSGTGTSETVTSLTNGTSYHFKTFVYNGSDWTPVGQTETGSCTPSSISEPSSGDLVITELCGDGISGTASDDGYIEIFNNTSNTINLDNMTARYYNLNPGGATETFSLTGTLAAGAHIVITQNAGNFLTTYGISADFSGIGDFYFNGGDDGIDIYHSTNGIIDQFNAVGLGSSPWTWDDDYVYERTNTGSGAIYSNWHQYQAGSGTPRALLSVTWDGSTNNDWGSSSNWDKFEPGAFQDATIPYTSITNFPTISGAASCYNLNINSTSSGDASLIGQSDLTVNGTTTIERYVSGFAGGEPGWHFLSSSVENLNVAASDFLPGSGVDDLFQWDEATNTWLNYFDSGVDATFDEGKGYLVAYSAAETKTFTGSLNEGTYSKTCTYNADEGDGWNLLGNPYPSGLDWTALTKDANVGGVFYIVDPADGEYNSSDGTLGDVIGGNIPPHQGFFVQVSAATTVGMETGDQVHTTTNFYKSEEEFSEVLTVSLNGETSNSNTYFNFKDEATTGFDSQFDGYKLFGWATIAQVYSELNDTKYSINCLPHSEETITIPLGLKLTADENLTLDFSGLNTFYNTIRIDLEDLKTGMTVNIRENPSYSFSATTADQANRFLLHFNGVTAVEGIEAVQAPTVYAVDQAIYINSSEALTADVFIYNINGQIVGQDKINGEQLKRVDFKASAGMYLVSIKTAHAVYTQKLMIK